MEKIYNITVGHFCNVEKTSLGYRYEIDAPTLKELSCIKDGDDMVDVVSGERYYLLKRDSDERLLKEEYKVIKLNVDYAIYSKPYEVSRKNSKERIITYLNAVKTRSLLNKSHKQLKK